MFENILNNSKNQKLVQCSNINKIDMLIYNFYIPTLLYSLPYDTYTLYTYIFYIELLKSRMYWAYNYVFYF